MLVCVALSSLVLSLSFCPSPFSGTTNDDDNDGWTDGRTTKSKYDYFHFSITRNLFLQAKFGEIKRESKKLKNEVILEALFHIWIIARFG